MRWTKRDRGETYPHKYKRQLVYPDFVYYDTYGTFDPMIESLIKVAYTKSDEDLAKDNLKKAPGRNPPLMSTNYVAEEEDWYWPDRTPFPDPESERLDKKPDWWKKLWAGIKRNTLGVNLCRNIYAEQSL